MGSSSDVSLDPAGSRRPVGHFVKYATCFLFGMAATKGVNVVLETKIFARGRMLDTASTVSAISMIRGGLAESGEGMVSQSAGIGEQVLEQHESQATTSVQSHPPATIGTSKSPNDPSAFDAIIQTASKRALSVTPKGRKSFNVTWWHESSGLTTAGGLNPDDRALLGLIYRNATSVFEYGLGESTYIANHVGVPRYAGIDSDPVWIAQARSRVAPHFRFYLGDIGETGAWGFPKAAKLDKAVWDYQLAPLAVEPQPFDVYMVDGRWRMPCLLASFLHASARGAAVTGDHYGGNSQPKTTVLLHDCEPPSTMERGRKEYKVADHLLDLVAHSGNKLCVYQRKPDTTDQQLQELWHQHMDQILR